MGFGFWDFSLKIDFDLKLYQPWSRRRVDDPSEGRAVDVVVSDPEVHRVEQIEDVGAQPQAGLFPDPHAFADRQVGLKL